VELATQIRKALSVVPDNAAPADGFSIVDQTHAPNTGVRAFVGWGAERTPAVVIPLTHAVRAATRVTNGVAFSAAKSVEFSVGDRKWSEPAAVIECQDPALLRTFSTLVASVLQSLPPDPKWSDVNVAFQEWERLLQRRRVLTAEEQLGLWGELWVIETSTRTDALVLAWQGPERQPYDFLVDELAYEIKTTHRPLTHFVSQTQVADGPTAPGVFVELHVIHDDASGVSVSDLVERVAHKTSELPTFEKKLLDVGYSSNDRAAYGVRNRMVTRPRMFARAAIPCVRQADQGVSQLRYRVTLNAELEMQPTDAGDALRRLGLEPASGRS